MTAVAEYARTDALSSSVSVTPPNDRLDANNIPTIETPAYGRSVPRWKKVRDVYEGTEAIRKGAELYLPRFDGETDALYEARKTIAGFFNGYARTLEAAVGMLIEPPPTLNQDMPSQLVAMWENVDLKGTHGIVFCFNLLVASIGDGFAGIFTEYPRVDDPTLDRSRASAAAVPGAPLDASDEAALDLRPYFILCKADEVLPVYETVNGKTVLTMFIRRQTATRRVGRFGFETVTYYHVHERNGAVITYERWMSRDSGQPAPDLKPTTLRNLTAIPWSPLVCGQELSPNEYKPTMMDLAELNITHHRVATGILSLEELAFVPTPVRIGAPRDADGNYPELVTGPASTIEVPGDVAAAIPVYYLSPPVDVLDPGMKSLDTCKAEMGAMGASFLAPDPQQPETATAHELDATAERATIGTIGKRFKDCVESAYGFAGQYVGEKGGSITVNQSFTGKGVDPQIAAVMMQACQNNQITLVEFRHYLSTGQLPETFKPENIRELLAQGARNNDEQDTSTDNPTGDAQ